MDDVLTTNVILALAVVIIMAAFYSLNKNITGSDLSNAITVTVNESGYQPALIQIPSGKSTHLHFVRTDKSPCSDSVIFPQFNIAYSFQSSVDVTLPPLANGEVDFTCKLGTYHGKILVG